MILCSVTLRFFLLSLSTIFLTGFDVLQHPWHLLVTSFVCIPVNQTITSQAAGLVVSVNAHCKSRMQDFSYITCVGTLQASHITLLPGWDPCEMSKTSCTLMSDHSSMRICSESQDTLKYIADQQFFKHMIQDMTITNDVCVRTVSAPDYQWHCLLFECDSGTHRSTSDLDDQHGPTCTDNRQVGRLAA